MHFLMEFSGKIYPKVFISKDRKYNDNYMVFFKVRNPRPLITNLANKGKSYHLLIIYLLVWMGLIN